MRKVFLIVAVCRFWFLSVDACTGLQDVKSERKREEEIVGKQLAKVVLQSRLGENVDLRAYDSKHFTKQKGPVDGGDELSCDFDSDCCWTNGNGKRARPVDWTIADAADLQLFERTFKRKEQPNGRFLVAASPFVDSTRRAEFVSCDVLCTDQQVIVSFRHWTTPNVNLQICTQNAFGSDRRRKTEKCDDIPSRLSPGPTAMSLQPGEYFLIKFVASNFTDKGGGMAVLDDITVSATPCAREPRIGRPVSRKGARVPAVAVKSNDDENKIAIACAKLTCDFEGTTCGYTDSNGRIGNRALHFLHGRIGGQGSGVQGAAKGRTYIGAILRPGDVVALEAVNVTLPESVTFQFRSFSTSANITMKVCFDDVAHCPSSLDQQITVPGDLWKTSRVQIPSGTRAVIFVAANAGSRAGTVGMDDIVLLKGGAVLCPPS